MATTTRRIATAARAPLSVLRAGNKDKGALAAVAIRRVVVAMQRHLAADGDGGQGGLAAGPVGSSTLYASEANFTTVIKAKAARIDNGCDAAFTLRLQQALRGAGRPGGRQHEK